MSRKAYILSFDRDDEIDFKLFHAELTALPQLLTWSHYIKSSYVVITNIDSATKLNDIIMPIAPVKRYLILEVNIKNRNGKLPSEGWEWMRNQSLKIK